MVYRIYVEKKSGLDAEATALLNESVSFLGTKALQKVRVINRYDVENIPRELFDYSVRTVFSGHLNTKAASPLRSNISRVSLTSVPIRRHSASDSFQDPPILSYAPQKYTYFTEISKLPRLKK